MSLLQSGTPSPSDSCFNHSLRSRYASVRQRSLDIAAPLSEADMCLQSMPDASPIRWHLAHTTWFFETFILRVHAADYQPLDELYNYLFNSYYNGIGEQFPRAKRGTQTRPTISEIMAYRDHVDRAMAPLLAAPDDSLAFLIELGLNHEQQHQELMLTDLKHGFLQNPAFPAYQSTAMATEPCAASPQAWLEIPEGVYEVGHQDDGFCFDNEKPRHKQYIHPCAIASRLVTNEEYLAFVADGGYRQPAFWLADGWDWLQGNGHQHPAYWRQRDGAWYEFTLSGLQPLSAKCPVTHINFYEANAFAAWSGKRLPTEFEWEVAVGLYGSDSGAGNFYEQGGLHPRPRQGATDYQFLGDAWEWTLSDYAAYPGFKPFNGNAGEYNGKFMCNQYVLRGGSCVTPGSHIRSTYRNFFYPHQNWQFTGIRLLEDR